MVQNVFVMEETHIMGLRDGLEDGEDENQTLTREPTILFSF